MSLFICFGCYWVINFFGYGFELYDLIGCFWIIDNGFLVDLSIEFIIIDIVGDYSGFMFFMDVMVKSE